MILRMQSPVLDIDANGRPVSQTFAGDNFGNESNREPSTALASKPKKDQPLVNALALASENVYTDTIIKQIIQQIETHLFFNVKERVHIQFDIDKDTDVVQRIKTNDVDQVILVHEVWQPPIRGLLHYIEQIKAAMPDNTGLWILLTQDAGSKDLSVEENDINFQVWKKTVFKLKNPDIVVQRFKES